MNSAANRLCLSCGLCCNGTLFSRVELEPGDDPGLLRSAGLPLLDHPERFAQPCPQLAAEGCNVYAIRPRACRSFACPTLRALMAGEITAEDASGRVAAVHGALAALTGLLPEGLSQARRRLAATGAGSDEPLPPLTQLHLGAVERILDRHFRDPGQRSFSCPAP